MNTKIFGGLILVAVLAVTSAAKADAATNPHHRKHKFEHRLKRDIRDGEITRAEAKQYHNEAKRIHEEKRMAKANGTFTPAEKQHIRQERKMLSHNLRREEKSKQVKA
jgi:hypothetical protein